MSIRQLALAALTIGLLLGAALGYSFGKQVGKQVAEGNAFMRGYCAGLDIADTSCNQWRQTP